MACQLQVLIADLYINMRKLAKTKLEVEMFEKNAFE